VVPFCSINHLIFHITLTEHNNATEHKNTTEHSGTPECEIPKDKKSVKRTLMKLKSEMEKEKRAFDLEYKKIKLLEDYLALK
jgi:hypothetical protein